MDPSPLGPCRVCGRPSWMADDLGPAHPCCEAWAAREPRKPCPSCAASRAAADARAKGPTSRPFGFRGIALGSPE
jgi:hypothetical protein